jgi:hypothetical protein
MAIRLIVLSGLQKKCLKDDMDDDDTDEEESGGHSQGRYGHYVS